jgi:hypothetical protein
MRKSVPVALVTLLTPLFVLAMLALQHGTGAAQGPVGLGGDTDPDGNSATFLGPREGCVSVNSGDTFDFDVVVSDIDNLVHWELYLKFDPAIIEVDNADMNMFLESNERSSLKVEWVPYSGGRHFLGAADLNGAPESGSGVLARLTLRAKAPGLSSAEFLYDDVDNDGDMDIGPRLTASGGVPIGDATGDDVFDGDIQNAFIAVDESCDAAPPSPTPSPSPTPQPGGGTDPSDTPVPPDALPVPGDPTFEPPSDTSPPADDASASEGDQDSTPEGTSEADERDRDDSEDDSGAAVLAADTPAPAEPGGGDSLSSSASGGGLPFWAIASIAAAVLVAASATSVVLAARAGGRSGR